MNLNHAALQVVMAALVCVATSGCEIFRSGPSVRAPSLSCPEDANAGERITEPEDSFGVCDRLARR
jgi:hypothetical protein